MRTHLSILTAPLFLFMAVSVFACEHHHHHGGHQSAAEKNDNVPHHPEEKYRHTLRRLERAACGTQSPSQEEIESSKQVVTEWQQRNHGRDLATKMFPIRVWWHVMKAGNTPARGAWSRTQAQQSIAKLNLHYRDTPFNFTLAGTTQNTKSSWFKCMISTEYNYKTSLRVEGGDTLNVYMCDLMNTQGMYGYAYLPGNLQAGSELDGVTVGNPFSGKAPYGSLDAHMTLVHEVGHWLGLYHTFEGNSCPGNGDVVDDTPAHPEPTWTYPGYENCFVGTTYDSCPDSPGLDPIFNHMNYVHTPCQDKQGEFTPGQIQRMSALFEQYRFNKTTCRVNGVRCMSPSNCCSNNCVNLMCV